MTTSSFSIDADFPGGNIILDGIDGDTIRLHQDPRDTPIWWFYWAFRVTGAGGRTLRFEFTDDDVFTTLGPCCSVDGEHWAWLGRECVDGTAFTYEFPAEQDCVYFAFCIPYQPPQLEAFLASHPQVLRHTLCRTEAGHDAPHLELCSEHGDRHVVFPARHHACESMANYEIEGLIDYWLSDEPEAAWLRVHIDFHFIPFMDLDGVLRGDQGKCRHPHDHNRDYSEAPIYATVRAFMAQAPTWRGRCAMMLDLHCPWLREGGNEELMLVEPKGVDDAAQQRMYALMHDTLTGPVTFDPTWVLPFGKNWNVDGNTSTEFFRTTIGAGVVFVIEFPYALCNGVAVSADNARQCGFQLGRAIARYLMETE